MNEEALRKQLHSEGFSRIFVLRDEPNEFYPDHTHATETAHIILSGEMALTVTGQSRTYRAGERCDVPTGAVHSA